jgi:hypothetical protein
MFFFEVRIIVNKLLVRQQPHSILLDFTTVEKPKKLSYLHKGSSGKMVTNST